MEEIKWIALSWITHITGTLSVIGSSSIICMVLLDRKNKLTKPNHRLMLSMSTFDVFSSVASAAATWPYPKETPIYGSIGTMATCKIQYFFLSLGMSVPMYNASLSLLYLLTIRHQMHFTHFATKIEPCLHVASILIPLTIATVPIAMNEVAPGIANARCGIRWDSSMVWPLLLVPFISFCVCLYSMTMVSCYVRMQSNKMKNYSYCTRQTKVRDSKTRATIWQAVYYTLAFAITFMFPLLTIFTTSFIVRVLQAVFYPLQGFWNFLLYVRPNVTKMKKEDGDKYLVQIIWNVVFHSHEKDTGMIQKRCKKKCKNGGSYKKQGNILIGKKSENSEESKQEINDEQINSITSENQNEDDLSITDRSIQELVVQTSTNNDTYVPDDSIEPRVIRRGSNFFFATADDDISLFNLDSWENDDEVAPHNLVEV